jgi:hypothetical protein
MSYQVQLSPAGISLRKVGAFPSDVSTCVGGPDLHDRSSLSDRYVPLVTVNRYE